MSERWALVPATRRERREYVGTWYVLRYRARARRAGVAVVAKQLKKQGVPLEVALKILGIRPSRVS